MAAADNNDVELAGEQHGVSNFTRSFHVELRAVPGSTWNTVLAALQHSMISFERYAALFAERELRRTFAASVLGRVPIGVTGLAVLLLVQSSTGSFARGGAAAGCYVAGVAVAAPAIGRLIDRYGPRRILLGCGLLFPSALIALVAAVRYEAALLALALAAAAGASFPPISVCIRTYFRRRVGDALLAAAYSAESVLIEVIFILGPMLVALLVAFASPAVAVWFAAACGLVGTALFLRSPALRQWHIEPRTSASLLGPLAERGFPSLVAVVLCFAAAFGFVEIGVVAYATEAVDPALAGVLLGVMSAGSALGGLAYGSRGWHLPLARQFATALALMSAGLTVLALRWEPWTFTAWCALGGIAMAPALIIQSMLAAKIARPEHSTEAFTWTTSALLAGVGIGLAAGGALLERFPAQTALAAGGGAALVAAAGARFLLGR
jgi:predicted MFS family arabinose efflux permease